MASVSWKDSKRVILPSWNFQTWATLWLDSRPSRRTVTRPSITIVSPPSTHSCGTSFERLVGAWDLREHVSADGLGTTMDAAVGQALDVSLDPLDVGRERSQHRLDLAASERAVQLLDLLEIGHVGNTKRSLPLYAMSGAPRR